MDTFVHSFYRYISFHLWCNFCFLPLFQLPPTLVTPYYIALATLLLVPNSQLFTCFILGDLQLLVCCFSTRPPKSLLHASTLSGHAIVPILACLYTSNHMIILPGPLIHSVLIPAHSSAFPASPTVLNIPSACPYQTILPVT